MPQINKTTDYDMFKFHENNRQIDTANLDNIKRSIQINNLLPFRPITVNDKMEILDGQHRFLAAKQLGLEIHYQINEVSTDEDIILLNANQKRWTGDDYINYYASKGLPAYIQVLEFAKKNEISAASAIRMMKGTGNGFYEKIRGGIMTPLSQEQVDEQQQFLNMRHDIVDTIERYSSEAMYPYKSDRCARALMAVMRLEGYVHVDMRNRIVRLFDKIRPCRTERDYFCMFLDIYNFGRKTQKLEE